MSDSGRLQGFPGGPSGRVLTPMQEVPAGSLSQGDALEKEMVAHSSTLAWEIHGRRSLAGYRLDLVNQVLARPLLTPLLKHRDLEVIGSL